MGVFSKVENLSEAFMQSPLCPVCDAERLVSPEIYKLLLAKSTKGTRR